MEEIINKVAASGLVTLDLEEMREPGERVVYDIKDNLFQGLILKEKDFRDFLKAHDWSLYTQKNVAITCSADAIIPTWAYMLLVLQLEPYANHVILGDLQQLEISLFQKKLASLPLEEFRDRKVVIKGCSEAEIPTYAYVELTRLLKHVVASLMFGEPCSTVPLYKKPRSK